MIDRYSRKIMKDLWSEKSRYDALLLVEQKASEAWYKLGLITQSELHDILKATYDLEAVKALELETKHDIIAFTRNLSERMESDAKKWIHYGLTSTDVVDTAYGVIFKQVNEVLTKDIEAFMSVLKQKAYEYKDTICVGRTHGIHADLTSFGLKWALWYDEMARNLKRFKAACEEIEVGKISGAVGNFANVPPFIQDDVCASLGLQSAAISTQVLQRDSHAHYIHVLALIGSTLEKIAVEIRHLSRTEVGEVREPFGLKQKGSSAMPHKKNPITSENISGCARLLRGYTIPAFENIALWHERDISHSSAERVIFADSTTLLDYMLNRYADTLKNLNVYPEKMLQNIELTQGALYAQRFMNVLIEKYHYHREEAYDFIQGVAAYAIEHHIHMKDLLLKHEDFKLIHPMSEGDIESAMDNPYYLKQVDTIYARVFQ
ncbi:adenylosuccinate lyase [Acholeplasma vituli]|uniref:Adenylosuccinate lyase n=1 Tax=Paracholeplasma vituli TaxID=69473 RepID=A0ABT2PWH5_9MOLU|nr:adenylosuccinate lyase [Paracholeplasma vituli]MCU0104077.1 adenylosuccinate lyase [Paracholeplasma vituli]